MQYRFISGIAYCLYIRIRLEVHLNISTHFCSLSFLAFAFFCTVGNVLWVNFEFIYKKERGLEIETNRGRQKKTPTVKRLNTNKQFKLIEVLCSHFKRDFFSHFSEFDSLRSNNVFINLFLVSMYVFYQTSSVGAYGSVCVNVKKCN